MEPQAEQRFLHWTLENSFLRRCATKCLWHRGWSHKVDWFRVLFCFGVKCDAHSCRVWGRSQHRTMNPKVENCSGVWQLNRKSKTIIHVQQLHLDSPKQSSPLEISVRIIHLFSTEGSLSQLSSGRRSPVYHGADIIETNSHTRSHSHLWAI